MTFMYRKCVVMSCHLQCVVQLSHSLVDCTTCGKKYSFDMRCKKFNIFRATDGVQLRCLDFPPKGS